MSETLKKTTHGQWTLEKSDLVKRDKCPGCGRLDCNCTAKQDDLSASENSSFEQSPNTVKSEEMIKFSPGSQWSIWQKRKDQMPDTTREDKSTSKMETEIVTPTAPGSNDSSNPKPKKPVAPVRSNLHDVSGIKIQSSKPIAKEDTSKMETGEQANPERGERG